MIRKKRTIWRRLWPFLRDLGGDAGGQQFADAVHPHALRLGGGGCGIGAGGSGFRGSGA